jgi:hypothetical protein
VTVELVSAVYMTIMTSWQVREDRPTLLHFFVPRVIPRECQAHAFSINNKIVLLT